MSPSSRAHRREVVLVGPRPDRSWRSSTTCPTPSTSTSSARCRTSSSATSSSAASCPSSTSRTRTSGASARSSSSRGSRSMDQYACTECARCSNYCPAFNTDKTLSPMQLIHDIRDEMIERGRCARSAIERARAQSRPATLSPGAHGRPRRRTRGEAAASGHAGCSRAPRATARGHADAAKSLRRPAAAGRRPHQGRDAVGVHDLRRLPGGLPGLHRAPARRSCRCARTWCSPRGACRPSWRAPSQHRAQLQPVGHRRREAHGLGRGPRRPDDRGQPEPRVHPVGRLRRRVRRPHQEDDARDGRGACTRPSVDFAVLGHQEQCTGDPARRAGNEKLFQMQAEANVEAMNDAKVTKVDHALPALLPHDQERVPAVRRQLRGHPPHAADRPPHRGAASSSPSTRSRRSSPTTTAATSAAGTASTTRRATIARGAIGATERHRRDERATRSTASAAAPAAGACGWRRRRHAREQQPHRRDHRHRRRGGAVACPFCTIMITDGMKARNAEEKIQVLDIAEVVAKSLRRKRTEPTPA